MIKKKLQIFVSSTYNDLKKERQAAVEAILTAGHIPAGMELFTAGDEAQLEVIKRWIDESDAYFLIIGTRYGSVHKKTGKSYTQLEYEYAVRVEKPHFAVVITKEKKILKQQQGSENIEEYYGKQLDKFITQVTSSKMVRFWEDEKDIKIAIHEKLSEYNYLDNMIGWVPRNESVNSNTLLQETIRLTKENNDLREQINRFTENLNEPLFSGLRFEEIYSLLNKTDISSTIDNDDYKAYLQKVAHIFGDPFPSTIHHFWNIQHYFKFTRQAMPKNPDFFLPIYHELERANLIKFSFVNKNIIENSLTDDGTMFLLKLDVKRDVNNKELKQSKMRYRI